MNLYNFRGEHYFGSFKGIDCLDQINIKYVLEKALNLCNITILNYTEHIFSNNGFTCIFLLSESHCSIHTYPEYNSFFIDLFTCGTNIDSKKFHQYLIDEFNPTSTSIQIVERT